MVWFLYFCFSSRRRHTRYIGDWSSDVCSSDLVHGLLAVGVEGVVEAAVGRVEPGDAEVCAGAADDHDLGIGLNGQSARDGEAAEIGRAACRGRVEVRGGVSARGATMRRAVHGVVLVFLFFKQKTAYEIHR